MKKLMVLVLVLAMTQLSWAGIATLRVAGGGDEFAPSDTITIELVTDFSELGSAGADTGTGMVTIESVFATAGEAMSVSLNAGFDSMQAAGDIINAGGVAVQAVWGNLLLTSSDVPAGEVLWSMVFHIPDLPGSSIIEISTGNFTAVPTDWSDMAMETNVLTLHIIPEPMTMGLLGLGGLFLRRRSK